MKIILYCESPVQMKEEVSDCLTLYLQYVSDAEMFTNLQRIWLLIDVLSGHCCLAYTLWKKTTDRSAEDYNGRKLILFLVTVRNPFVIYPLHDIRDQLRGAGLNGSFHGEICNDIYFCVTASGLTAPIFCPSFFCDFFLSSISWILFAELHIKPLGEPTKPKSATFMRCKKA